MPRRAFTLVELLATIAIIAILVLTVIVVIPNFVSWAKSTADKQTLTVLNDALNRYKCEGGNVNALTVGAPMGNILSRLKSTITWGGRGHNVMQQSVTYPARSLYAAGAASQYHFTRYNTYQAEAGGTSPSGVVAKNFQRVHVSHQYPGNFTTLSTTAGNTVVVFFSSGAGGAFLPNTPTITSSTGNSYQLIAQPVINGSCAGLCFVATNIIGGSETVTVNLTSASDVGLTAIEYSGVTGVDVIGIDTAKTTLSVAKTTTDTDMFLGYWMNEQCGDQFLTTTLNPGGIAGVEAERDHGHWDGTWEWLNGGIGYPQGSYTNTVTEVTSCSGIIFLGLK